MINRSLERARRQGVDEHVEFRLADIGDLPFEDGEFDMVLGESVLAFIQDKQKGVYECVRVLKSGGYFGINEATWISEPSPELLASSSQSFGGILQPLTADGWEQLLVKAGLGDIVTRTHDITVGMRLSIG